MYSVHKRSASSTVVKQIGIKLKKLPCLYRREILHGLVMGKFYVTSRRSKVVSTVFTKFPLNVFGYQRVVSWTRSYSANTHARGKGRGKGKYGLPKLARFSWLTTGSCDQSECRSCVNCSAKYSSVQRPILGIRAVYVKQSRRLQEKRGSRRVRKGVPSSVHGPRCSFGLAGSRCSPGLVAEERASDELGTGI